jgi:4-diphosphocytidyl-2-C-methyl-D-erythritol kinase
MIKFPNAKINLGLNVIEKRSDGYHNIESIFYPVKLYDVLEIVKSEQLNFYFSGKKIEVSIENNLCSKAYQLIKKKHSVSDVNLYLKKILPMGAGMGGGSADGAFTLLILNELFKLQLSKEKLKEYALQLGSDCPFFIDNCPSYVQGRGEMTEPLDLNLNDYTFIFVNTGVHISTAEAYQGITPAKPVINAKNIVLNTPVEQWKDKLVNDFEEVAFKKHPNLAVVKNALYNTGALYASMTGSGSAFYGIYTQLSEDEICLKQTELYNIISKFYASCEILKEVYLH